MPTPSEDEIASLFAQHRGGDAAFGRFLSSSQLNNTETWQDARGYTLSDRVWFAGKQTTSGIDDVLTKAVLGGTDSLTVAKQLEQYLSPAFSPIRGPTGRLVRGQAAGIVTRTPGRAGAGSYAARRLARTEISRAHGLATIGVAERNPFSVGVKWNLSAAHSEPDECNTKASRDTGLGRGVYPKGSSPGYPLHPHEMCFLSSATNKKPDAVVAELRKKYGLDDAPSLPKVSTTDVPFTGAKKVSKAPKRADDVSAPRMVGRTHADQADYIDQLSDPARALSTRKAMQNTFGEEYFGALTPEKYTAIQTYSTSQFAPINALKRGTLSDERRTAFGPQRVASLEKTGNLIQEVLDAPQSVLPQDVAVFRGATSRSVYNDFLNAKPDDIITDKGFMSSSLDLSTANDFAERHFADSDIAYSTRLRILAPEGTKGSYIEEVTQHQGEREVIFAPGTKLRVHKVEKSGDNDMLDVWATIID